MQKSNDNTNAKSVRRKVQSSTTLNRRYVKRPGRNTNGANVTIPVKTSPRIQHFHTVKSEQVANVMSKQEEIKPAKKHPMQIKVHEKMQSRVTKNTKNEGERPTAQELKDAAIKRALSAAERTETTQEVRQKKSNKTTKVHFGFGRILLAVSCAAAAVFAIVYFVNLNMPDISLRVAAMQTGIEASYPNYVPRDFSLSDITSEEGRVTLNFRNATTGDSFTLVEEESSWDSNALLANYVKDAYGDNYTVIKEQGLTLYVSGSDACWVNGGVVFKLKTNSGSLTKKQIKSIATSL